MEQEYGNEYTKAWFYAFVLMPHPMYSTS